MFCLGSHMSGWQNENPQLFDFTAINFSLGQVTIQLLQNIIGTRFGFDFWNIYIKNLILFFGKILRLRCKYSQDDLWGVWYFFFFFPQKAWIFILYFRGNFKHRILYTSRNKLSVVVALIITWNYRFWRHQIC